MFRRLLVPLDRSSLAEQAVGQAAAIARACHAALDLVLVHQPLPFAGFGDAPWNASQIDDEEAYLESIAEEVTMGAGVETAHAVVGGEAIEMICRRAWEVEADLVVMTSHGRTGLSRAWIGSVADGVVRHSAAPVLMLRPVERKTRETVARHLFGRILVPLDGSVLAADILPAAASLARSGAGRLTLLRIVQPVPLIAAESGIPFAYPPALQDDPATDRLVADAREQMSDVSRRLCREGVDAEAHVITAANIARAILDYSRGHAMDAIAMSTHGRGMSRLLVGSVADKVLRGSGLPMLMHRPLGVSRMAGPSRASSAARTPAMARG